MIDLAAEGGSDRQLCYDLAGRLVKVDYGSSGSIIYTYYKAGNLLSKTVTSAPSPTGQTKAQTA